jgi:hypothetical protein
MQSAPRPPRGSGESLFRGSRPNPRKGTASKLCTPHGTSFDLESSYVMVAELWALTESITVEFFEKTHDNNFDLALTALTLDLNRLISAPTSAAANY